MPVILTGVAAEAWHSAPVEGALALQRPWPAEAQKIVATGARQDALAAA